MTSRTWHIRPQRRVENNSIGQLRQRGTRLGILLLVSALFATNTVLAPTPSHAAVMAPTLEFPFGPLSGPPYTPSTQVNVPQGLAGTRAQFEFEVVGPFIAIELSSQTIGIGFSPNPGDPATCFVDVPKGGDPVNYSRSAYLGGNSTAWTNPSIPNPPANRCATEGTSQQNVGVNDVTKVFIETNVNFPVVTGSHVFVLEVMRPGFLPEEIGRWDIETQAAGGGGGGGGGMGGCPPFSMPVPPALNQVSFINGCPQMMSHAPSSTLNFSVNMPMAYLDVAIQPAKDVTSLTLATSGDLKLGELGQGPNEAGKCVRVYRGGEVSGTVTNTPAQGVSECVFTPAATIVTAGPFLVIPFRLGLPQVAGSETLTITLNFADSTTEALSWTIRQIVPGQQQAPTTPQLPVVLSPQGVGRAIGAPGSVWGMIGGRPATTVVNTPSVGQLTAQIGTVQLALAAPETNGSPLPGGGFVSPGGDLDVTASGFFPFSAVRVWSVSEQRLLATSVVAADGTVEIDVTLPNRPNACRETVQISGSDASAEQIAASLTLRYALDNPFANERGAAEVHAGALACLANRGVMSGVTQDRVAADRVITRAQVAALITRALGLNGQSTAVSDVNQNVHQDAIRAAIAAGLITPFDDGTFRPDMPVTRAELVRIVATAANIQPADTTGFTDVNGETARLAEALRQAGIVRGTTDARFSPDTLATRAQTASIIDNLLALIETSR